MTEERTVNPEEIIADLPNYPGPDGRGLINAHWHGRVVAYSHGGHRDRINRIVGTNITAPFPHASGFTRASDEIPSRDMERQKREFRAWVESRPWFVRGMRVDAIDDACMRRIEYRVFW